MSIIELPSDVQDELRALEARGDRISHYELLGVSADADREAIRRAYLTRSRRFHPDAYYQRNLGELAGPLSRAFRRINAAYQALADDEARAEYDRTHLAGLSESDRKAVERRELSRAEEERRDKERRHRLLRSKGFARIAAARKLYEEALALAADGQRGLAVQTLQTARELDPQRKEITSKLAELERAAAKARAESALLAGRDRQAEGNLSRAMQAYTASFQSERSAEAAAAAARCAFQMGDHPQAANWCTRALECCPDDASLRILHARALIAMKQKVRAKAELSAVLQRDPKLPEAKDLLRSL